MSLPSLRLAVLSAACVWASSLRGAELPKFEHVVIDPNVGNVCYAVTLADVDGDKRQDIVAVTESRVVWYQNPDWKLRTIVDNQTERDNVCIAPHDIDGDGKIDFALGAGWLNGKNLGTIQWLSRKESLDDRWTVHGIGAESWLHRMRWGDFLGLGRPQLIISPLNKTVGNGVRLMALEIPAQAASGTAWPKVHIDDTLNAMHNHWVGDLDGDGEADLLTASQEGVHWFQHRADGEIVKHKLSAGASDEANPAGRGAGEIKVGRLPGNKRYIATVEPMHGNQIVVYLPGKGTVDWTRHVLDDTVKRGHAIACVDIDHDGADEFVLGHSDLGTGQLKGPGVFCYDPPAENFASAWTKSVIDNGDIATEDLVAEDLNGDGWIDIVAGGRATHNVKLYINQGGKADK